MTLTLSRELRTRLYAGEAPPITGEGRCPVKAGETVELSSRVSLKVVAVRRRRKGGWSLQYELHDRRHVPRLLRRTPGIHNEAFEDIRAGFDEFGYPGEPTADAIKQAARESGYTSVGGVPSAGEAVDERTQNEFTKQAQTADNLREQRRRERFEKRSTLERLAAARAEAVARGIDISHHERVIADRVDRIERQLGKDRAA